MNTNVPVHAVKESLIRLKRNVDSLLDYWDEAAPVREDFRRQFEGDCDYRIGDFKIKDARLRMYDT